MLKTLTESYLVVAVVDRDIATGPGTLPAHYLALLLFPLAFCLGPCHQRSSLLFLLVCPSIFACWCWLSPPPFSGQNPVWLCCSKAETSLVHLIDITLDAHFEALNGLESVGRHERDRAKWRLRVGGVQEILTVMLREDLALAHYPRDHLPASYYKFCMAWVCPQTTVQRAMQDNEGISMEALLIGARCKLQRRQR